MEQRAEELSERGFPIVEIAGRRWCAAERLDEHIGGRFILGGALEDGVIWLEVEGGARLPLYCPYCGAPARLAAGLEGVRAAFANREVLGFQRVAAADFAGLCADAAGRSGPAETWAVIVLLSGEELEEERSLPLGLASVRGLAPRAGWGALNGFAPA